MATKASADPRGVAPAAMQVVSSSEIAGSSVVIDEASKVAELRREVGELREQRRGIDATLAQRTVELVRTTEALQDEISRRRWAEKNLGNSEARYQSIFEHAVEGIYQSTPEGRFISVNPALARMYGYESPDELMAAIHDVSEHVYVSPEDLAAFRRQIGEHGVVRNMEYRVRRRDGQVIWIRENARGVFGPDRRLLYYEGMIQDVTAEHRAREEKEHLESQLKQSQKMEAVGRLAGGIAHDFNNILGIITGYTGMVLQDLEPGSRMGRDLQEILSAATRAKEVVQQILTFSRRQTLLPRAMLLEPVFEESLNMLRASLPAIIDLRSECLLRVDSWVVADAVQFQQVILNLGVNAAHAMRDSVEARLLLRLDNGGMPPTEWVATGPVSSRGWVRLSVADTGCGMTPDIVERIFDPYFTTKNVGEGTGLGLSVVHGIVKALDGEIRVNSRPGEGTEFEIFLPVSAPADPEPPDDPSLPVMGGGRILLLDDEPALLRVTAMRLERAGFSVQAHNDPAQALEQFALDPGAFDVVLTDHTMPVMTGIDFARKVRGIRPDLPVILCSGHHEVADSTEWHGIVEAMLAKPFEEEDLLQLLQRCISR
jgi:two-component system, cell cycle sensor histidine kinase and response regulator CckA